MKRVLSLILVLSLASTANALLTDIQIVDEYGSSPDVFDIWWGDTIGIGMYSGNSDFGLAYLAFEDNGMYTLSNPQMTSNAGDQGGYIGPFTHSYIPGYQLIELTVSATASSTVIPGTMFMVDLTAVWWEIGTVDVRLYNENLTSPQDTLTITIAVPEPMTITLLALGGLAILRKRGG